MISNIRKILLFSLCSVLLVGVVNSVSAQSESIPSWIKNNAKLWSDDTISDSEFLNAIKYLIENDILIIESLEKPKILSPASIIIPNGNSDTGNAGFYLPLNLEVYQGTTVVWINDDVVPHTVQSQDGEGNVVSLFNSDVLETGDRFAFIFEDEGVYNYFCTLHPWRVGVVTVK